MSKYFYIITFDGQIFELTYTEQKLNACLSEWQKGGLLVLSEVGGGIHANSISKILNSELYDSYVLNVKPKLFIKNGTWYDGIEYQVIKHEPWKLKQIDERKLLEAREEPMTPEQIENITKIRKQISERFPSLRKKIWK